MNETQQWHAGWVQSTFYVSFLYLISRKKKTISHNKSKRFALRIWIMNDNGVLMSWGQCNHDQIYGECDFSLSIDRLLDRLAECALAAPLTPCLPTDLKVNTRHLNQWYKQVQAYFHFKIRR